MIKNIKTKYKLTKGDEKTLGITKFDFPDESTDSWSIPEKINYDNLDRLQWERKYKDYTRNKYINADYWNEQILYDREHCLPDEYSISDRIGYSYEYQNSERFAYEHPELYRQQKELAEKKAAIAYHFQPDKVSHRKQLSNQRKLKNFLHYSIIYRIKLNNNDPDYKAMLFDDDVRNLKFIDEESFSFSKTPKDSYDYSDDGYLDDQSIKKLKKTKLYASYQSAKNDFNRQLIGKRLRKKYINATVKFKAKRSVLRILRSIQHDIIDKKIQHLTERPILIKTYCGKSYYLEELMTDEELSKYKMINKATYDLTGQRQISLEEYNSVAYLIDSDETINDDSYQERIISDFEVKHFDEAVNMLNELKKTKESKLRDYHDDELIRNLRSKDLLLLPSDNDHYYDERQILAFLDNIEVDLTEETDSEENHIYDGEFNLESLEKSLDFYYAQNRFLAEQELISNFAEPISKLEANIYLYNDKTNIFKVYNAQEEQQIKKERETEEEIAKNLQEAVSLIEAEEFINETNQYLRNLRLKQNEESLYYERIFTEQNTSILIKLWFLNNFRNIKFFEKYVKKKLNHYEDRIDKIQIRTNEQLNVLSQTSLFKRRKSGSYKINFLNLNYIH